MQTLSKLKIKITTILLIIIPLIVVSYSIIWENGHQRKEAEVEKNLTITKSVAEFLEHEISDRMTIIKNITTAPVMKEANIKNMPNALKVFQIEPYENYFVTDSQGKVLAHTFGKQVKTVSVLNSPSFQKALKAPEVVSGLEKSAFSDEYVITLYARITDDKGLVKGIVGNELPINFFAKYLQSVKIGKTGRVTLVDDQGYYIFNNEMDNYQKLILAKSFDDAKGREAAIKERIRCQTGEKTIFTMVRLDTLGWYVIAFQDSSELSTPGTEMITKNMITLVLLAIIVFVLWRYKVALEYRNFLMERQNSEKLALVGELAAGMAHEIRNPLTTIKGFSDLLKRKDCYQQDKDILDLVGDSVDHIEGIVRETLLLAKPQKMNVKEVNLAQLVRETHKFMKNEALLSEVDLALDIKNEEVVVEGDALHLKQVLVNLLKNSLDASERGRQILIKLEKQNAKIAQISIIDHGDGISPEVLEKIGRPFFTTKAKGTGLGLSVCQRIVHEHKGNFSITSRPGEGTTVTISLPVHDA